MAVLPVPRRLVKTDMFTVFTVFLKFRQNTQRQSATNIMTYVGSDRKRVPRLNDANHGPPCIKVRNPSRTVYFARTTEREKKLIYNNFF